MYYKQQSFIEIKSFEPWLVETRRKLHLNPELSEVEWETQKFIEQILGELEIPYERSATTGVVAILKGGLTSDNNNVIGIRADIDALPMNELKSSEYQSRNKGVMHACGHDAHTTILLGTLRYLKEHQEHWSGTVKGFFQPAEETVGGAKRMVEEGCMDSPKANYVLGLHVMPYLEVGQIETREGKLNAASDGLKIIVKGKSAHGAYPEKGVDAINISAQIQLAIANLMSRQISPLDQAVVSINQINGGMKDNIICDEVVMSGMMRTTDENIRGTLKDKIEKMSQMIALINGGEAIVTFSEGYKALVNDANLTKKIKKIANLYLGEDNVFEKELPSLGVEDFSFFLDRAPGAFYHLGCGNKSKGIINPLHSNTFDIDESCLAVGVFLQCEMSLAILQGVSGV